ncbi:MAG: thiamine-phosphate pyrophosphorylase [Epsilonproteobacteria bacterium]|nr:thiamine-phosphate pyrophosphorylase [Campylobacterales bacterium]MBD3807285.1 thiamine-phosphate pyrophosphorylase [Campylobacterota bacterium]
MRSLDAMHPKIARLIDANLNRLKEGIRVIEDICRYIHDDSDLTATLKTLRHQLQHAYDINRLNHRDIESDVQKQSIQSEQKRESLQDIIIANFSRTQESSRVLEELFKLTNIENSEQCKAIRYQLYAIETNYFKRYLSI